MRPLLSWGKTQVSNLDKIILIARFDQKANHQNHVFGLLWEFLSPAIQIIIYYLVFGIRLNGQTVIHSDIPYIYWMLTGLIPWFYMSASIVAGAGSITRNLNLIAKTHFPVEILPTIAVVKGLNGFFVMQTLFLLLFISQGFLPTLEWLQLIYYFFCMLLFLLALAVLTSAITVIFRDLQLFITSAMRLLFFISGAVVNVAAHPDSFFTKVLTLNPFVYIIEGFRDALLSRGWFFDEPFRAVYFFSFVLIILLTGIYITNKYRANFVEYM